MNKDNNWKTKFLKYKLKFKKLQQLNIQQAGTKRSCEQCKKRFNLSKNYKGKNINRTCPDCRTQDTVSTAHNPTTLEIWQKIDYDEWWEKYGFNEIDFLVKDIENLNDEPISYLAPKTSIDLKCRSCDFKKMPPLTTKTNLVIEPEHKDFSIFDKNGNRIIFFSHCCKSCAQSEGRGHGPQCISNQTQEPETWDNWVNDWYDPTMGWPDETPWYDAANKDGVVPALTESEKIDKYGYALINKCAKCNKLLDMNRNYGSRLDYTNEDSPYRNLNKITDNICDECFVDFMIVNGENKTFLLPHHMNEISWRGPPSLVGTHDWYKAYIKTCIVCETVDRPDKFTTNVLDNIDNPYNNKCDQCKSHNNYDYNYDNNYDNNSNSNVGYDGYDSYDSEDNYNSDAGYDSSDEYQWRHPPGVYKMMQEDQAKGIYNSVVKYYDVAATYPPGVHAAYMANLEAENYEFSISDMVRDYYEKNPGYIHPPADHSIYPEYKDRARKLAAEY